MCKKTVKKAAKKVTGFFLSFLLVFTTLGVMIPPQVGAVPEPQNLCEVDLDVVMIIDRSGSMYGSPLAQAKIAANNFLGYLGTNDQSALVSFATSASLDNTLTNQHSITQANVSNLTAGGLTNTGAAIAMANQELLSARANPQAVKAAILLTDGYAHNAAYAEQEAQAAANDGIKIFTIGLGDSVDAVLLQTIASITGGQYYYAPTPEDLEGIYNSIKWQLCQYGSISGCKYKTDLGGSNGLPIPGWEIILGGDADSTQLTDGNGCYQFSGLVAGNYTVSEAQDQEVDYVQIYPQCPSFYSITLADEENATGYDFGNYLPTCGNGVCDTNYGEDCSTCPQDCGDCDPTPPEFPNEVWVWALEDLDENGTYTAGEISQSGVTATLECTYDGGLTYTDSGITDTSHWLYFDIPDEYIVDMNCHVYTDVPAGLHRTPLNDENVYFDVVQGTHQEVYFGFAPDSSYCGDGVCDDDENCSDCPEDCGECESFYGPYCGDDEVNQPWEQCDGTCGCTQQCQYETHECNENVFAKVDITEFENWCNCNMTDDIYLGQNTNPIPNETWFPVYYEGSYITDPDLDTYEDVPGLAVHRGEEGVTARIYGSHQDCSKEHVQGFLEFWNNTMEVDAESITNETGQNKLENPEDGIMEKQPGQDEMWLDNGISNFWMTVTTADDGYTTSYDIPVCEEPVYQCNDGIDNDQDTLIDAEDPGCWGDINDPSTYNPTDDDEYNEPIEPICSISGHKYNNDTENLVGWTIGVAQIVSCTEEGEWADYMVDYSPQGTIAPERMDPQNALGVAERDDTINFVSLGMGGELILEFDNVILNECGDDIEVVETSFGDPSCTEYPEKVNVYASQNGTDWEDLGIGCLDSTFDLGSLPWAKYVKLVDVTDPDDFPNGGDGFDVDGVRAINCGTYEIIDETETDDYGYCFEDLEAGTYIVYEEAQGNWHIVDVTVGGVSEDYHVDSFFDVFVEVDVEDSETTEVDFYNQEDAQPVYQCSDGIDNDGDGLIDYPEDPGCENAEDDDESNTYCGDGVCNGDETCSTCPQDCGACSSGGGGGGGIIPLSINNYQECVVSGGFATFEWRTNKASSSRVVCDPVSHNPSMGSAPDYGYSNYTDEYDKPVGVVNHNVTIPLYPGITYYCRVISSEYNMAFEKLICSVPTVSVPEPEEALVVVPKVCEPLIEKYIKLGANNDVQEVRDLEWFLNTFEGENLPVNGIYEKADYKAVKRFQEKYKEDILEPWGLKGPTGYVYYTTRKKINEIYCGRAFPLTQSQLDEIEYYRNRVNTGGDAQKSDDTTDGSELPVAGKTADYKEDEILSDNNQVFGISDVADPPGYEDSDKNGTDVLADETKVEIVHDEESRNVIWFVVIIVIAVILFFLCIAGRRRQS